MYKIGEKKDLTGYIICGEEKKDRIAFYLKGYELFLLSCENSKEQIMYNISTDDGYIYGVLHSGNGVVFYVGDSFEFVAERKIKVKEYILFPKSNAICELPVFDCLEFCGGTLNSVFQQESIKIVEHSGDTTKTQIQDDSIAFDFNFGEENIHVVVSSHFCQGVSINDGIIMQNTGVNLRLFFSKKICVGEIIKHYDKIRTILGILVFRKNTKFEWIRIHNGRDSLGRVDLLGDVYIENNDEVDIRKNYECIMLKQIQNGLSELFRLIYNSPENKPSYMFGFIPDNGKFVNIVTNSTVRELCSALECETSFRKEITQSEDAKKLEKLKSMLEEIIEIHKTSDEALSSKSYDVIRGNMSNWSLSASDKLYQLFKLNEEFFKLYRKGIYQLDYDKIHEFKKHRDKITHGTNKIINESVEYTCKALMPIVYSNFLHRIGVDDNVIKNIVSDYYFLR